MRVAIVPPYLFPYIGYFQLIAAVDQFVIYDTVKYTKKGSINRNRFLRDGAPVVFTLPIEKDSDQLDIRERRVAACFNAEKLCGKFAQAYRCAPYLSETMPLVEEVLFYRADTLFGHLRHGLARSCAHLGIDTPIRASSEIEGSTDLRRQDRVLDICERLGATTYIDAIGGMGFYEPPAFARCGLTLRFLYSRPFVYPQLGQSFVPWLSIVDVLMFNSRSVLGSVIRDGYDLVEGLEGASDYDAGSDGIVKLEPMPTDIL